MLYEDIMSFRLNFTWCEINADIQSFSMFKLKGTMWNVPIISQEVGATQVVRMGFTPLAWRRSQHKIGGVWSHRFHPQVPWEAQPPAKETELCVLISWQGNHAPLSLLPRSNGAIKGLFAFFPMLFSGSELVSSLVRCGHPRSLRSEGLNNWVPTCTKLRKN